MLPPLLFAQAVNDNHRKALPNTSPKDRIDVQHQTIVSQGLATTNLWVARDKKDKGDFKPQLEAIFKIQPSEVSTFSKSIETSSVSSEIISKILKSSQT